MSEDLINAENAFTDVKKRNEKLKLIINEHKVVSSDLIYLKINFTNSFHSRIQKH